MKKEIELWCEIHPTTFIGYNEEGDYMTINDFGIPDECGMMMSSESGYDFWCEVDEWICENFCDEKIEYDGGYDTHFHFHPVVDGEIIWDTIIDSDDDDVFINGEIDWEFVERRTYEVMRDRKLTDLLGE